MTNWYIVCCPECGIERDAYNTEEGTCGFEPAVVEPCNPCSTCGHEGPVPAASPPTDVVCENNRVGSLKALDADPAACIEAEIRRRKWKCSVCGEESLTEYHLCCPEAPAP